jgi:hypothetical protein
MDQGIRAFERDGPLVTLPRFVQSMETYVEPTDPKRWFCVYRTHVYTEKGVRTERLFGGKNMRCYHDLEVVLHVARKWMPARPDAKAFVYEVFPLEGTPPLEEYKGQQSQVNEQPAATTQVTHQRRSWRWTKFGRRTRLVLVETLVQPEHRVVQLTEELVGRRSAVEAFIQNTKRSARDPSA